MVLLGTKAMIFVPTKDMLTWYYYVTEGFYLGPAMDHFRYHRIYVKETRAKRISDTVQFIPTHCRMPYASSVDKALVALKNLVSAISKVKPESPFSLKDEEAESIKKLAKIFKRRKTTESVEALIVIPTNIAPQRVNQSDVASPRVVPLETPQPSHPYPTPRSVTQNQPTGNYPSRHHISHRPLVVYRYPTRSRGSIQANISQPKKKFRFSLPNNVIHIIPNKGGKHHIKLDKKIKLLCRSIRGTRMQRLPQQTNDYLCALHEKAIPTRSFIKEEAHAVLCKTTGELLEYQHLLKTEAHEIWSKSFSNKICCLAQGNSRIKGINTIFFIHVHEILTGRKPTYGKNFVNKQPEKAEVHQTQLIVGGNLINYPGDKSTATADLTTAKILFNSILSTEHA